MVRILDGGDMLIAAAVICVSVACIFNTISIVLLARRKWPGSANSHSETRP